MTKKIQGSAPVSPLRYPGAKRWMAGYISRAIACNKLSIDYFIEPFAGGASVSLSLLHNDIVEKVGLIERDPLIAAFWYTLFFDTDWLVNSVLKTEVTLEKWEILKDVQPVSTRQKAFKCLFLNRTSFSGILKSNAGPIGGKAQTSKYKIDCRFTKNTIVNRIRRISEYRDRIAFVWNLDWKAAIDGFMRLQRKGSRSKSALFYLDPPFYKKGKTLYPFYFKQSNHIELRDYLIHFDQPWILSYDLCPEIIEMYKDGGFNACDVNLIYTTSHNGQRGLGKEVIVSNLPNMVSELQIGADKRTSNPKKLTSEFLRNNKSYVEAETDYDLQLKKAL